MSLSFSGFSENIDSLFNHYVFSKQSQRNAAAEDLVYIFNKEECYDYPITYKHLGNHKMLEMLAYLGMANHEYNRANFLRAVHCAEKALLIVPEDSLLWRSSCYEILNVALQRMGDYSKALQYAKLDYETGIKLANEDIVELDDDKKAAMVSNLLVVLCGDDSAQPVVNTGTLNH